MLFDVRKHITLDAWYFFLLVEFRNQSYLEISPYVQHLAFAAHVVLILQYLYEICTL